MKSRRKVRRSASGTAKKAQAESPRASPRILLGRRLLPGRWTLAAGLLALFLLLLGGLWFFLPQVAGLYARGQLEEMGVPEPRLTVTRIGLGGLELQGVTLGAADEATARRVTVTYDLFGAGPSPLTRVDIQDPLLKLDLSGAGPLLGSLQPLLEPGDSPGESGALPPLPEVAVTGGRIEAATLLGPASVAFEGGVQPVGPSSAAYEGADADFSFQAESGPARLAGRVTGQAAPDGQLDAHLAIEEGALALAPDQAGLAAEVTGLTGGVDLALDASGLRRAEGKLSLSGLGLDEARFRDAEIGFKATEEAVTAEGRVLSEDGGLRLEFDGGVTALQAKPRMDVTADLFAKADAALLRRAGSPLETGVGRLTLDLHGDLPALAERPAEQAGGDEAGGVLPWLLSGAVEGRMGLVFSDLAVPERFSGMDGQFSGPIILADGTAALTLEETAEIHVGALAAGWLASLGLPADLAEAFTEGATVTLGPNDPLPAGLALQPVAAGSGGGFEAVADGVLTLAPAEAPAGEGPRLSLSLLQARVGLSPVQGITQLDLPDASASLSRVTFQGIPIAQAEIAASLFGSPDDLEADSRLTARIAKARVGALSLSDLELDLPLHLTLLEGALEAFPAEAGKLTLGGLGHSSGLRLARPASASLTDAAFLFSPPSAADTGGDRLAHDLRLSLGRLDLTLARADGSNLPIVLKPASLRIIGEREGKAAYHGRASLSGQGIDLSALALSAGGFSATVDFDAAFQVPSARFAAKSLSLAGAPPLSLEGQGRMQGRRISLEAKATPTSQIQFDDFPPVRLSAVYDTASGRADLSLSPLRLAFTPGGLQPSDLAPQLALLSDVSGEAELAFQGAWQGETLSGDASLVAEGLSFTQDKTRVEGLDLSLALDQLWPPHSPSGQSLRIARLETVTPIENIATSFQILPGSPAKALIEQTQLSMIGGRFQIRNTLVDPDATKHQTTLEVLSVALNELFATLDVSGLTGSGTLAGQLPISVDGDQVVIADGRLESTGPGILSYRRVAAGSGAPPPDLGIEMAEAAPPPEAADEEDAAELLQDPMRLTLRALENFHYDRLVLGLDKGAKGETRMLVQLSGKNPDLLDGYPFNLNINLKADITPILEALDRGLALSRGLLGGAWTLSP